MSGIDKEKCPRCKKLSVYSEHRINIGIWRIYCACCNLSTSWHSTWKEARIEWDAKGE